MYLGFGRHLTSIEVNKISDIIYVAVMGDGKCTLDLTVSLL
jgi:hypothetical protein